MSTEFNKVKSGVIFTKAAQKQDLQSGDTIPEALGKIAKYMDVTDDALSNIQPILTFDSKPEYESLNPVTSGGLYDYIELQSPTYINTFSTESDLYNYSGNLTNNDYAFVGTGSGATYYMNVYQYKSEVIRDTIENIKTVPSGSNILKTLNEPALPSGNIQYKLDCYVTAVNNQSYGTSPVISVIFSDNTTEQITVPNANKTHIVKTYSKPINAIQFMNSGQASDGYTDFEDIQILTTAGWNKLSYRLYNPTWDANQLSAINSGVTSTKVTNYDNHIANKSNPHEVTKSQVGLGNVGNFKAVSTEASQGLTTTEQSNARTNINAQESLSFNGTYNASTNKVATESTVTNAINALDVSSQGGAGKYISEISETNGKISATPTTMDTSLSSFSTNNNCPTSKTVYDDQQRQETEIGVVANAGAKNYCPYNNLTADSAQTIIDKQPINLPAGTYVLSCSVTASTNSIAVRLLKDGTSLWNKTISNTGGLITEELTITDNANQITFYTGVANTISDIMIRPAYITDSTFVPYAKTNVDLTNENANQQLEIDYAINTGVKNVLPITNTTSQVSGITFTVNADNTVTSSGTLTSGVSNAVFECSNFQLPAGTYTYTCEGAAQQTVRDSYVQKYNGSTWDAVARDYENNTFTLTQTEQIRVRLRVYATGTSGTFKPMIRHAEITSSVYQPYADTNPVLTQEVNWNVNNGVKNLFDINETPVVNHTTYTLTDEKLTVIANGIWAHYSVPIDLPAGNYILSLIISDYSKESGAPDTSMRMRLGITTSGTAYLLQTITGNGTMTIPFTWDGGQVYIQFYPNYNGTSYANSFSAADVMIRPASITDDTFVPYAIPNPTLTPAAVKAVNEGAKNQFDITSPDAIDYKITHNISGDTATITGSAGFSRYVVPVSLKAGSYIFTANVNSISTSGRVRFNTASDGTGTSVTSQIDFSQAGSISREFTINQDTSFFVMIYSSTSSADTSSTLVISQCMICTAADYAVSKKFVPYSLSNPTLTQATIKAVDEGSKNKCKITATNQTARNVTFTVDAESGTITANGTANATDSIIISDIIETTEEMFLTGTPSGASGYNVRFGSSTTYRDTGSGVSIPSGLSNSIYFAFNSGTVFNNVVLKPMICTASDWAVSKKFVPYAPTNRELFEEKIGIEDAFGTGTQITANGTLDITQLGKFYCTNAATAATVTNAPWIDAGFFGYTERSIVAADRYIQIALRNDDSFRIAKRRYIGSWQPWSYIDTYDEGNLIPDNANLNDYTQGGKYYGGNSAGNSVLNLPVSNESFNFSLEVKNASPVHTLQYLTILRAADDPYIYKRRYYNGAWGSWYRFEGTTVTS